MKSTRYSVTTTQILDATIKNEDIDANAAITKSKISQVAAWLAAEIPNLDTSKLTTGLLPLARGGLAFAPVLIGNASKSIRVNLAETALELSTVDDRLKKVGAANLNAGVADILEITGINPTFDNYLVSATLIGTGNVSCIVRLNNDATSANYQASRITDGVFASGNGNTGFDIAGAGVGARFLIKMFIRNSIATQRKSVHIFTSTGTGTTQDILMGQWANVVDLVNRISFVNITGLVDYDTPSKMTVHGWND